MPVFSTSQLLYTLEAALHILSYGVTFCLISKLAILSSVICIHPLPYSLLKAGMSHLVQVADFLLCLQTFQGVFLCV